MAEEFKDDGNTFFKSGAYEKAIESYTMSLSLDTSNAVYAGECIYIHCLLSITSNS